MSHEFHPGPLVRRRDASATRNGDRIFEVTGRLPEERGEPGYRIRSMEAGTPEAREAALTPASCAALPTASGSRPAPWSIRPGVA